MRTLSAAVLLTLTLTSQAFAADPPDIRSKFYDMGEQVIDGEIKRPQAVWIDSRQRARFTRLLSLKKSFLPAISASADDRIFK